MINQMNLVEIALALLQDEATGDIVSAKKKMDLDNYSMTWMYHSKDTFFPVVKEEVLKEVMENVYETQDRQYEIMNTAQNDNIVFIEMIESYPNSQTGKVYRTPITLVLEFNEEGKVVRGRHYCDPDLSDKDLSTESIHNAIGSIPELIIKRMDIN